MQSQNALMPFVAGVPYYRAKKLPNGPESAFSELSLRPMPEAADTNGTQAAKSKSRARSALGKGRRAELPLPAPQ
jgi:hypothetical protein